MKRKEPKLIVSHEPMPLWEFHQFVETVLDWSENQKRDNSGKSAEKKSGKKKIAKQVKNHT